MNGESRYSAPQSTAFEDKSVIFVDARTSLLWKERWGDFVFFRQRLSVLCVVVFNLPFFPMFRVVFGAGELQVCSRIEKVEKKMDAS